MNFLAHIYLSGNDDQLMIGNFIADFVKGKKKDQYPDRIRQGIELHRAIDDYTDHHEITHKSKDRLRAKYSKYSGIIVDLYYDHFLAAGFEEFSAYSLQQFSKHNYSILIKNWGILPSQVHYFLPFMIGRNWLLNYATVEGIGWALKGLSRRVSFENRMDQAVNDLQERYQEFESDFNEFFPQLIEFSDKWKSEKG